jgi:hypothetical protein
MILIKEVEPWPIQLARDDLRAAITLFYYARYGLDMRERLEVNGPYEFKPRDMRYLNGVGVLPVIAYEDDLTYFERHKDAVIRAASYQLVVACYSVVEFLIANLVLFLYLSARQLENPEFGFQVLWETPNRDVFLADARIADIESDAWMNRHFLAKEQDKRISLLDDIVGLGIRSFVCNRNNVQLSWSWFVETKALRNSIAHSAGRASLYSSPALAQREISSEDLLNLEDFVTQILTHIRHRLYEIPIIRYVHQPHTA